MRSTRVSTVTSSPNAIGERKSSSTLRQDERQAIERHVGLQDVEQVANPRQLDVAEEDRVVHVPEGVDVAEAHLQRRAVAVRHRSRGGHSSRAPVRRRSERLPDAPDEPGQQRRARHHAGAGRATRRPSDRRRRPGRGRRASAAPAPRSCSRRDAPPVAASCSSKPSSAAIADGQRDQPRGRIGLLHRRVAGRATAGSTVTPSTVGEPARRSTSAAAASKASAVAARRSTWSSQRSGDHVRPRAAVDHAGVDGHRRPAAVERVERQHLVRRLQDGGAALLRLDARVGRAPDAARGGSRRCPCAR